MRTICLMLLLLACGAAYADEDRERQQVIHVMGDDRIAAGGRALFSGEVAGDLVIAGGDAIVIDPVGGDLLVAGGEVRIDSDSGQDVYALGGRVSLNGRVGRNARLAGGRLELGSQSRIAGNATLAGGSVMVLGDIEGELAIAGGRVYLNGRVGGSVDALGGEIELGPQARIAGNLHYRSPEEIERAPGAEIGGAVVREPTARPWREEAREGMRVVGALLLVWLLGLMLLGAVLVGALPRLAAALTDIARARPWLCLLLGFVALVVVPAAVLILLATAIGIPLALLSLTAYLALLMLGYVVTGVVLGQIGLRRFLPSRADRTAWRAAAAALAIMLITLLSAIPFVGWLAWLAALLGGMGALLLQLRAALRQASA